MAAFSASYAQRAFGASPSQKGQWHVHPPQSVGTSDRDEHIWLEANWKSKYFDGFELSMR